MDTWFSSWLWPFATMGWPEKTAELKKFYPTTDLVTGPDIIFFWVARMMMAGFEFMGGLPFHQVYFTGLIRDENTATLTVISANETLTLAKADIEDRKSSDLSMMPDNLCANLDTRQVRDLLAYLRHPSQTPVLATVETAKAFFNGKDLAGWSGDEKLWRVEQGGEIVGKSPGIKRNSFLKSDTNEENSGIQFRSEPLADGEMRGPQADAGKGWWGKLYEESGRGLLWKDSGEKHVKPGEWNDYVVEAVGPRVRTWINGQLCVDLNDEKISRKGVVGLQIHSGGPLEVRFRKLELEVLDKPVK